MLYIIVLAVTSVWTIILIRKRKLSWHSIIATYAIGVFSADMTEVTFNLLLGLYKFPTHLLADPVYDNELGIVFSDTLILPFTLIIFIHYVKTDHPWKTPLLFALGEAFLELIFVNLGYLTYIHWHLIYSTLFYMAAFRFFAYLAPRIVSYNPPIPQTVRLLVFAHTIIMWIGAIFSLPLLKMYQFRPGVFKDIMADCRFTDLLSGDALSVLCALFIPRIPYKLKPLVFTVIACLGTAFALYANTEGWLIYNRWNHFFTVLRYFVPLILIMLYDRWELSYQEHAARI